MTYICKGLCRDFKAKKEWHNNRYLVGQKYCTICVEWLQWNGGTVKAWSYNIKSFTKRFVSKIRCPCCGIQLRANPRNMKFKRLYKTQC